jgi:hypothetical protein
VPKLVLRPNTTYYWRVRHCGDSGNHSEWSDLFSFTTEDAIEDMDLNGIPDDQEVDSTVDLDNDGIPDIDENHLKCVKTSVGDSEICVGQSTNVIDIEAIEAVDRDTIDDTENMPDQMPIGIISFRLRVNNVGDTATVTVYLAKSLQKSDKWYGYEPMHGWQDYSVSATIGPDGTSVILEFKDGGFGDADGAENGVIVDPSGPVSNNSSNGGDGGGRGCFIATVVYGSQIEPHVSVQRKFRDRFLLNNSAGEVLVELYYAYSPPVADFISKHISLKAFVRRSLMPVVGVSWMTLQIGPAPTMAFIILAFTSLVHLAGYRRKFRS